MTLLSEIYDVVHNNRDCCSPRATLAQNFMTNHDYNCDGQAPTANFTADIAAGNTPLIVQFTDTSTGGEITSYLWNFGDGTTSTEQNPSHIYTTLGDHTVSLTVTGPAGSDTIIRTDYIGIVTPPEAEFVADKTAGVNTLDVQFTDQSTGIILYYDWDFGDGTVASGERSVGSYEQNPMHTFTAPGSYTVKLKVTGSGTGDIDEVVKVDYIKINVDPPAANFVANKTAGGIPFTVQFTGTTVGTITDYLWNFGDGQTSTELSPSHTYTSVGVYTVSFTATGPGGSDVETKTNYITAETVPVAQFTSDKTSGPDPLTVQFTDQSTGVVSTRRWNFGDGYTSTLTNPSHVYNTSGVYTVSLTVTGPGGVDVETKTNYIGVENITPIEKSIPFDSATGYIQEDNTVGTVIEDSSVKLFADISEDLDTILVTSVSSVSLPQYTSTLFPHVTEPYLYISEPYENKLYPVNISDPLNLVKGSPINPVFINETHGIQPNYVWVGNIIYICNRIANYVYCLDMSDPEIPIQLGILTFSSPSDLGIIDNYLYVSDDTGLYIYDVSVTGTFTSVTSISLNIRGFTISGNYLYAVGYREFTIYDMTNRTSPVLIGSVPALIEFSSAIMSIGDYIYICEDKLIYVINVVDKTSPSITKTISYPGVTFGTSNELKRMEFIFKVNNHLYVYNYAALYLKFDVSDPSSPTLNARINYSCGLGETHGIYVTPDEQYGFGVSWAGKSLCCYETDKSISPYIQDYTPNTPYYITTTPTTHFELLGSEIESCVVTYTQPAGTTIFSLVSFDNKVTWKKWNGSAWATHAGGLDNLQTGNTVPQIITGLTNLDVRAYQTIDFAFDLNTTVTTSTPSIDDITITYV